MARLGRSQGSRPYISGSSEMQLELTRHGDDGHDLYQVVRQRLHCKARVAAPNTARKAAEAPLAGAIIGAIAGAAKARLSARASEPELEELCKFSTAGEVKVPSETLLGVPPAAVRPQIRHAKLQAGPGSSGVAASRSRT